MTELKTLKDLETWELSNVGTNDKIVYSKQIKAEAVKWFKKKFDSGDDCCCTCEEVWREFFNITEEDLK